MHRHALLLLGTLLLGLVTLQAFDPFRAPDTGGELTGSWTCKYGNVRHTIAFNADQTFTGTCWVEEKVADRYEGTWQLTADYFGHLELVWSFLKSTRIPAGRVDRDAVEILNDKLLVLWTTGRQRHAYQRVPTPPPVR